jgi:carboxyl-terminal processing protease
VGQGNKEPVDAVNMKLNRVVDMIRGPKGSMVHLVVLPAGASEGAPHKEIVLKRDTVSIKDSLAKADIILHKLPDGGTEKVGVIILHDFYNKAAADTEKLVQRLKRENVAGIILDVRNNGGGLLDQAIDLTGLFVPRPAPPLNSDPVVQVRLSDGYIQQLGPENSNDIYNGPLMVMVNKASASATEITAGALQDYGRAIIVGDASTHGKGTVQTLIPLQDQAPIGFVGDPGKLKLTVQKFYRVAGGSTQQKGVVPDIILPSLLDGFKLGETTLPYYLPYDTVPAAPFDYLNLTAAYLPALKANSEARVASSPDFNYVRQDIAYYKKKVQDPTVSLNEATRLKEQADLKASNEARKKDLEARKDSRDKVLELTLDMVEKDMPAAPPVDKKPKVSVSDDADDDSADDPDTALSNATDDPQLDEAVKIMCDYTQMLHDAGSKLVQAQTGK